MFETAELGRSVSKAEFKKALPLLREKLLELQNELRRTRPFPVIMLFAGVDGGGKGATVNLLNEWMDPRWLRTCAYDGISDHERAWPEYWRYWRDLPPCGQIGMFLSAWYSAPVLERVYDELDEGTFLRKLDDISRFEQTLAEDGGLVLKFWMHLSRDAQEQRLKSIESDPLTEARVRERHWENFEAYDRFIEVAEQAIRRTHTGSSPWTVVEGADPNYRSLTIANLLHDNLQEHLQRHADAVSKADANVSASGNGKGKNGKAKKNGKAGAASDGAAPTVLSCLDMSVSPTKDSYRQELVALQARLHRLHLRAKERELASVLVFEGPDAAGKGGAIRRVTAALDARNYRVHGIAAPTDEEQQRHYLWRFWRRLPAAGRIAIFDRSWYGRVLVERIEGFALDDEWRRAYGEINHFEDQLIEHGCVLLKFWIHITEDEQLARFKARKKTSFKRWKLTDEDWRNRDKWHDYEEAVNDMVQYTSTSAAPWVLVAGNDKRHARLTVLRAYVDSLATALGDEGEQDAEI